MSTGWTAPGSTGAHGGEDPGAEGTEETGTRSPQQADGPWAAGAGDAGRADRPAGPRRELSFELPLFPLRPLNLGEVLGAAVRIYRLRPKPTLVLSAAVYGVAFVLMTAITGAGMVPFIGEMQTMLEDPAAANAAAPMLGDVTWTIVSTLITMVITVVAASLVTVVLTRIAIAEATAESLPSSQITALLRRLGLPAIGVSLLVGVLSTVAFIVPVALGALPLLIIQEATVLPLLALAGGLLLGLLATLFIWARTVLAVPSLAIEETGVIGAVRRSFAMTAGRRLWRVLGLTLMLMLLYTIALQVVGGVFGMVAGIVYVGVLLATGFEGLVLGVALLTVISMLGSYIATFLLAPFISAGTAAIYADNRMRHEAWDVELTRRFRESQQTGAGAPGSV